MTTWNTRWPLIRCSRRPRALSRFQHEDALELHGDHGRCLHWRGEAMYPANRRGHSRASFWRSRADYEHNHDRQDGGSRSATPDYSKRPVARRGALAGRGQEAMAIGGDNLSLAGEQCHANDKNRKAFRQRNRAQPQSSVRKRCGVSATCRSTAAGRTWTSAAATARFSPSRGKRMTNNTETDPNADHYRAARYRRSSLSAILLGIALKRAIFEDAAGYRLGSDCGSPNHGSTLLSKRVMAQIRSPVRVSTRGRSRDGCRLGSAGRLRTPADRWLASARGRTSGPRGRGWRRSGPRRLGPRIRTASVASR